MRCLYTITLSSYCRGMTADSDSPFFFFQAEDGIRDLTVTGVQTCALPIFRGEAKVSSWLHRIAVNQCITRQRRAKVRGETALEDEAEKNAAVFALPLDVSPARTAEKVERSVAVRRAVGALPPDLRQVVVMKEFEELTFQQISEVLELPLSTVKSRLYTALRQLQMRLQKFGEQVM